MAFAADKAIFHGAKGQRSFTAKDDQQQVVSGGGPQPCGRLNRSKSRSMNFRGEWAFVCRRDGLSRVHMTTPLIMIIIYNISDKINNCQYKELPIARELALLLEEMPKVSVQ